MFEGMKETAAAVDRIREWLVEYGPRLLTVAEGLLEESRSWRKFAEEHPELAELLKKKAGGE